MADKLRDLRQKKGQAVTAFRALVDAAAGRAFSAEEQSQYDRANTDLDALDGEIQRTEKLADLERQLATIPPAPAVGGLEPAKPSRSPSSPYASAEYRAAYDAWLQNGYSGMGQQHVQAFQAALQADSDPAGGFLVMPQEMSSDLIKSVDNQVFIRAKATKRTVTAAQSLGAPSLDADPADADWTSEIATGGEDSSMTFGKRELHPHPLAKRIKISRKLLRLTAGGAGSLVTERLGYKFAVTEEKAFLLGSGASQPLGLFTPSASGISTGRDVATGSGTSITADALYDAFYFLKGPYAARAEWMLHRDALKIVRKLKDTTNQYLWQPGLAGGQPNTLVDRPINTSEYVPNTFTSGLYVGMLGDLSYYWIAESVNFELQRLNELYAETNQVGFIGRQELDGMPVLEEAFARLKTN